MENKIQYPKGERVWVGYYDKQENLIFIITSKPTRDFYFLYEVIDDGFRKLGKDKDPSVLVSKYGVKERMRK